VGNGFPTRPSGKDPGVYKNYTEVIIMVVQHNMQAANANRMLNLTVNGQQKSTEKLSSGYRINRAADDAAGLAISEKMRSQIRGLDKASSNAQDGISVVQTAEGALNEVHSMLQRMNELATQAANDTNTSQDRSQIQLEVDQLTSEINRVASTTQFNTMNLLDGSFSNKNLQVGSLSGQKIELNIGAMNATGLGIAGAPVTLTTGKTIASGTAEGTWQYFKKGDLLQAATFDNNGALKSAAVYATADNWFNTKDADGKAITIKSADAGGKTLGQIDGSLVAQKDKDGNNKSFNAGDTIVIGTDEAGKKQLQGTMQVDSFEHAGNSMKRIQDAIDQVSTQRANLGAVQNRLEHTIANLDNVSENTQSAESRIRDTDMAKEMVQWSKNNILQQAGQSMLAQANQSNQGVLSLLQ